MAAKVEDPTRLDISLPNAQNEDDSKPHADDVATKVVGDPTKPVMRRSDRLKKSTSLTTMEKNQKMAKKRNLEGNPSCSNSFSTLPIEEIAKVSTDMGVVVEESDFDTFDLLKDLEKARGDLYKKQSENHSISQTE